MDLSCVDCGLNGCRRPDGQHPPFCPAEGFDLACEAWLGEQLDDPKNRRVLEAAAVSAGRAHDDKFSRLEETIVFARGLGVRKIGIAACVSLAAEARMAAKAFRAEGFEVVGTICKIGSITHGDLGLDIDGRKSETVLCNPIYQAKLLNEEHVDLNVVMGLCAGHDALFLKYADALCTVLVTKDFKYDHNSVLGVREHDRDARAER